VLNSSTKLHLFFAFSFSAAAAAAALQAHIQTLSKDRRTFSRQIVRFSCATPAYLSLDHEMPLTFHA
jgi:hypothetical protein